MFEDKEEVQKAMLGLKIFGGIEGLDQSEEVLDSTEEVVTQVQQSYRKCMKHYIYFHPLDIS